MTHADCLALAQAEADRTRAPMFIFRMPAWPPDCYGVYAHGKLPEDGAIERVDPTPEPAPQGSLF